jgi:hypothetical protein
MGRRSEELKALMERAEENDKKGETKRAIARKIKRVQVMEKLQEFPVENVDYWIWRQEKNTLCSPGFIHRASSRSQITKSVMKQVFENLKTGLVRPYQATTYWSQTWLVYPGPKPDKKWGPRCP